ncbi:MAG: D-alanyl-D-alanine carboxypeptidase family protein, partial [Acidimicrobiia bacterium]|nr:D-alanyl-D-alanine carboxypeptidase family protein [Acidimicrobiia bacterium]
MRTSLVVVALCLVLVPAGAALADSPRYEPDEFDLLFRTAPLDGLAEIGPPPAITGNSRVDARIRAIAESRGYLRRPLPDAQLVHVDGIPLQDSAAAGWRDLRTAAARHGYSLRLNSGYRTHSDQVSIFVGKLTGTSDSALDQRLRTAAAPGYSKHHTGYAVDLSAGGSFTSFGSTAVFRWMSANNAAAAKAVGFIPSYPEGASSQGPIPEAWEWVYVGVDVVECGRATLGMPAGTFDDAVGCASYPLARGSAAHLMARAVGVWPPTGESPYTDDDGLAFEPELGVIDGLTPCGDALICPFAYLTRAELASLLAAALGAQPAPGAFDDIVDHPERADIEEVGELIGGCDVDSFCPDDAASRSMLLGAIERARAEGLMSGPGGFIDVIGSTFEADAIWLAQSGISKGCNPPFGDLFCADEPVTRGQMAAFLVRGLGLDPVAAEGFSDMAGSVFEADVAALAAAGVTRGCNPPVNDRFCPDEPVTRGQMAAFLVRGLGLDPVAAEGFSDMAGSVFEADVAA